MFFSGNKQIIVEGGDQQQQQIPPFGMPPHFHPSMMVPPPHGVGSPHHPHHPHAPPHMPFPPMMSPFLAHPHHPMMSMPLPPNAQHMIPELHQQQPPFPLDNLQHGIPLADLDRIQIQPTADYMQQLHYQQQLQQPHLQQQQIVQTIEDDKKHKSKQPPPQLTEIFDDLSSRFVINIPSEELESFERLLFQIEAAYWFYDDFYREEHHSLPKYSLSEFTKVFFHHCPFLKPHKNQVEEILKQFSQYKTRVPVYGAIILNPTLDKALFVRGFHSSSWGFPKGKVNKDEPDEDCAVREVIEETGYDISKLLNPRHFIEITMKEQKIKLFIICGVPEDTPFHPKTRKEISKIEWLSIEELPTFTKKTTTTPGNSNQNLVKEKNFFRTIPFFNKLKRWISNRKRGFKANAEESFTSTMMTPKTIAQPQQQSTPLSINTSSSSLQPPQYSPYPLSPPSSPRGGQYTTTPDKQNLNLSSTFPKHATPTSPRGNTQNDNVVTILTNSGRLNRPQSRTRIAQQQSDDINNDIFKQMKSTTTNDQSVSFIAQQHNRSSSSSSSSLPYTSYNIKSTFFNPKEDVIPNYPPIHLQNYQQRFTINFDTEELTNCFRM